MNGSARRVSFNACDVRPEDFPEGLPFLPGQACHIRQDTHGGYFVYWPVAPAPEVESPIRELQGKLKQYLPSLERAATRRSQWDQLTEVLRQVREGEPRLVNDLAAVERPGEVRELLEKASRESEDAGWVVVASSREGRAVAWERENLRRFIYASPGGLVLYQARG